MDNKETAEHFRSRSSEVPLWHRQNISVEEASGYTGLGRDTIYSLTQEDDCDFRLYFGAKTMWYLQFHFVCAKLFVSICSFFIFKSSICVLA